MTVTVSNACTPEPLLRRLLNKEELAHQACVTFHTILVYMGDLPGRQSRVGLELTDLIFTGPLKQASTDIQWHYAYKYHHLFNIIAFRQF